MMRNRQSAGISTTPLATVAEARAPIVYGIVQPGPETPGGVPFVQSRDVGGVIEIKSLQRTSLEIAEQYRRSKIAPGDILFSLRGNIGRSSITPAELDGANIARGVARIRVGAKGDPDFVRYVLQGPVLQRLIARNANGSTFRELSIEELRKLPIPDVSLPEQRKIAEILRAWDEAIEKLEVLRAAKLRRITSVRQRLFEAAYASHNRLKRARDIFETVSERARPDLPLLAVMQDVGIVRRDELDRRVAMPDGDTSSYKVVRPRDFVISLRSFEGGLEYSMVTGLVSPAYTVLRPTTQLVGDYYRHFFKSRSFIGRLDKLIFGIRDGKQIAFRDFGDMYIPAPPLAEQETQSCALRLLEADLALEKERIETLTRQKRGLMQKLLTGEWRVSGNCGGPVGT
ncbi:restriction endonuclease subunit S (plasmid) [Tistrella mobilis]|uniref:restriction endonuclease subunit S n=1 Tax=Tistrella mobilis TaxID=171437 RepID=UPI0035568A9B